MVGKILVVILAIAIAGVITVVVSVEYLWRKSEREIIGIVGEFKSGTQLSDVEARLGRPSQVHTNRDEIALFGTTKEEKLLTNSVLYLFGYGTIPMRWVVIYTDKESKVVLRADWKDM